MLHVLGRVMRMSTRDEAWMGVVSLAMHAAWASEAPGNRSEAVR